MLASLVIPRFAYAVTAARLGVHSPGIAAAIAPDVTARDRIGDVSAAAAATGVANGMRLSEALALCPRLVLLPPDPAHVARKAEELVARLEDAGAAVEPLGPGQALLDARPIWRLYGGAGGVTGRLQQALPGARVGLAARRFTAILAANRARRHDPLIVEEHDQRRFLDPLPVELLARHGGIPPELTERLRSLGLESLGAVRALPHIALRDRFGPQGELAWQLAAGCDERGVSPRRIPAELRESLRLPDAASNIAALQHALWILVERLLGRPERAGRAPRALRLSARLVGGSSWTVDVPLREPTAERARLLLVLRGKLQELPGPAEELELELADLAPAVDQRSLLTVRDDLRHGRLEQAIAHLRATAGRDAALRVIEVDLDSRLPERRFGLVPR